MAGAIIAFKRGAISLAMATGARISAPFAVTPWGSNVPRGNRTVCIFPGTHSRNSIQLMRSISRVLGACASAAIAPVLTRQWTKQSNANGDFLRAFKTTSIRQDHFTTSLSCHVENRGGVKRQGTRLLFALGFHFPIKRSHTDA